MPHVRVKEAVPVGPFRREARSTKTRLDRSRLGFARRLFACFLAALFAAQPTAWASSACSKRELTSGMPSCCCSVPASALATSCCSTEVSSRADSDVPVLSLLSRCSCELQAPVPLPALPRESSPRGNERGSDRTIDRWIESGALASASTPLLDWASPPGDPSVALHCGLHPFDSPTAAVLVRRPRGLLDLICVARC